jgi:hypothetical protein
MKHVEEGSKYFVGLPIGDQRADDSYEETIRHRILWRAVIDQVVDDLRAPDFVVNKKGVKRMLTGNKLLEVQRARRHAELWVDFHKPHFAPEPSIVEVCDLAGLDPQWVAKKVKELSNR